MKAERTRRSEASPNKISFDKHSSFADRTHLAAYAFRFGLRAGSGIGFIPPAFSVARNNEQNFVSRSCKAYRRCSRSPQVSPVALRAICCIHTWSGCRVIPAKRTRRLSRVNEEQDVVCRQPTPGEHF